MRQLISTTNLTGWWQKLASNDMLKKIVSHAAIYGMAPYVTKIVSFFILPIITQDLTPEDYGIAGVVAGYTGIFSVLASLGLPVILSNSFIKHESRYRYVWRHIYGFLSWWNIIYGILVASLLLIFLRNEVSSGNLFWIVFLSVGPIIFFGPTQAIGTLYYQLNKNPVQVVWRTITFGLLTIALNVYTISVLKMGYMGWFWSEFIVGVLFNASYWWALNFRLKLSPILKFRWYSIKRYLKVSLPVVPHQYSSFLLRSSDRAVLGFLKVPTENIGRYSLASNFGNYFYSVSSAISTALNPFILKDLKHHHLIKARALIFMAQVMMFVMTFIFSLWSKEILFYLIKNDELRMVYPMVIVVVMAFSYRPMYIGATSVLFFYEKTKDLAKVSFIAGLANVILNLVFVPRIGFEFAAYSTFICYMYVGYSGYFLKQFSKYVTTDFFPLLWLALTVALTVFAYVAVEWHWISKTIITVCSGALALWSILKFKATYEKSHE
jgi:O-antigen/teichoic acid export membrane protein